MWLTLFLRGERNQIMDIIKLINFMAYCKGKIKKKCIGPVSPRVWELENVSGDF
jgi:hypothetical protein